MNRASQSQASGRPRPLLPKPPPEDTMRPSLVVKLKVPSYFRSASCAAQSQPPQTGEMTPPINPAQAQDVPRTDQTEQISDPTIDTARKGNRPPDQLKFQSSPANSSSKAQPQVTGSDGLDTPNMSAQAQSKPTAQQGESRVDSIVSMPENDASESHKTPKAQLPQGTPAGNTAEGVLYAAHKRKRNRQDNPSDRFAKYSKGQIEGQLIRNFEKEHGRKPGLHELHDNEIRRGIPPGDRVWTTLEEQVLIDQGQRPKDKFLGPRKPEDGPEEEDYELVQKIDDD